MKRVVVTGLGVISPLGNTLAEFWKNVVLGKNAAGYITRFDASRFKTRIACEVKDFDPFAYLDKKEARVYDLFTQFAVAATDQALADSGLDLQAQNEEQRSNMGVIWASGNGGIGSLEKELKEYYAGDGTPRFSPFLVAKMIVDIAAGVISIRNGLLGPNYATVSACASSNTAIINAFDLIRMGKAKVMLAGGSEAAITESSVGGFSASHALSKRNEDPLTASRPFDRDRDGFVIAEGAGALLLEELDHALERKAPIYAEMLGGGMAADAYHLTGTHPEGLGASLCMGKALQDAGLRPEDIDYINAHATSTVVGDISELHGIRRVFSEKKIAVTAPKSMMGHLLGAAGAVESIVCVLSVRDDVIPGTLNTMNPDQDNPPEIDLVLGPSRYQEVRYALNNTFGFGGHTASSIFAKYRE